MLGTVHKKYWYFYHDALFLIIAAATMKWMVETMIDGLSVKDIWLVSQNEANAGRYIPVVQWISHRNLCLGTIALTPT